MLELPESVVESVVVPEDEDGLGADEEVALVVVAASGTATTRLAC